MTEILEQLEINHTFFIQFFLFGVFFILSSILYLKPAQKLLEKRNTKLKNDVASAAELLKTVEQKIKQYETELLNARIDGAKSYEAALAAARGKEEQTITQIKEELKKDFSKANQQLQEERLKVESELKLQINQMSDSAAVKVLGDF